MTFLSLFPPLNRLQLLDCARAWAPGSELGRRIVGMSGSARGVPADCVEFADFEEVQDEHF